MNKDQYREPQVNDVYLWHSECRVTVKKVNGSLSVVESEFGGCFNIPTGLLGEEYPLLNNENQNSGRVLKLERGYDIVSVKKQIYKADLVYSDETNGDKCILKNLTGKTGVVTDKEFNEILASYQ
jgi:hypothetical protein